MTGYKLLKFRYKKVEKKQRHCPCGNPILRGVYCLDCKYENRLKYEGQRRRIKQ